MKKIICAALLAGTALVAASTAEAAVGITFNFGGIAMGYTDGYYDTGHHWHQWRPGEWDAYRRAHPHHANGWRHDDRNHGHHDWHH